MLSICSNLYLNLVPPWKHDTKLLHHHHHHLHHSKFNIHTLNSLTQCRIINSFSKDDSNSSPPNQNQLGFDPSEELYGIDVGLPPRDLKSDTLEPRSWFGPNGQYIKELPCPSCRGRGYTPCAECGIERSRQDCSICSGKGMMTCQHCLGECVIWEESIDEIPWEKARSISPFKVKEDDEVDNMELKLDARKKSKRVYRSTPPEVGQKISRSLKSLNAQTGLFSKRMKMIHRDPTLHAQRVAAIKKAKGTDAARKHTSETLKKFFSDPENRRKRSVSMKGIRYICKNCGQGHRTYYCPELGEETDRRFKCGWCGEKGHNRRTCQNPRISIPKQRILREFHCRRCGKAGHNRRTCSLKTELISPLTRRGSHRDSESQGYVRNYQQCGVCGRSGHNRLTCSQNYAKGPETREIHCQVCGKAGHNRRTCPLITKLQSHDAATETRGSPENSKGCVPKHLHRCRICGIVGHNRRTCSQRHVS